MFNIIKKIRRRYIIKNNPIPNALWARTINQLRVLDYLTPNERIRLKKVTTLFLHDKTITPVQGFELTEEQRLIIAVQACLLILNLDLDYYDGWVEIVVYPDTFVVKRDITSDEGIVSSQTSTLSGEAWSRGSVILSWADIERDSFTLHQGHNVVIHEFAHKLDMLNGRANGMPPLHPKMKRQEWTDSLENAYDLLINNLQHQQPHYINEYAATNPAEFFAVISEYFFTAPRVLQEHRPAVYEQLVLFYKQKPIRTYASTVNSNYHSLY